METKAWVESHANTGHAISTQKEAEFEPKTCCEPTVLTTLFINNLLKLVINSCQTILDPRNDSYLNNIAHTANEFYYSYYITKCMFSPEPVPNEQL